MSKFLKKIVAIAGVITIMSTIFVGCKKEESNDGSELQTVRLNEVVRSVFYAPMYVAITEGFFEEEGLEIDLSTGQGADTTHSKQQNIFLYNNNHIIYLII